MSQQLINYFPVIKWVTLLNEKQNNELLDKITTELKSCSINIIKLFDSTNIVVDINVLGKAFQQLAETKHIFHDAIYLGKIQDILIQEQKLEKEKE